MKKHLILALMAAFAAFSFCSCGDDEPEPTNANNSNNSSNQEQTASAITLAQLENNQMTFGDIKQITFEEARLDVRSPNPSSDDNGAHYLSLTHRDSIAGMEISIRFDINTPVVGKDVDLTTYGGQVYNDQFNFGIALFTNFNLRESDSELWYGEMESGYFLHGGARTEFGESETCFKEGRVKTSHTDRGFTLELNGTTKADAIVALKVFIPEDKIDYWK